MFDRLCVWLAARLPRRVVYFAGLRVLSDVTSRPDLSYVERAFHVSEVRMAHALESWINRRR